MFDDDFAYLSSPNPLGVLTGIESISARVPDPSTFTPSHANATYSSLIPKFLSNHYKIRRESFCLGQHLLEDFPEYIEGTATSTPYVLRSLHCAIGDISDLAFDTTRLLFRLDPPASWWPHCEPLLLHGKSVDQRLKLLQILVDHADEIPIVPIIRLLSDAHLQIQRLAKEILDKMDPDEVQRALEASRARLGIKREPIEFPMPARRVLRDRPPPSEMARANSLSPASRKGSDGQSRLKVAAAGDARRQKVTPSADQRARGVTTF
jgi:hypothetical protein